MFPFVAPLLANFNPIVIFRQCDPVGKAVVLLLIVYSFFVWAKMLQKFSALSRARNDTRRFHIAFSRDAHPLRVFMGHDRFSSSPLYLVYDAGCRRLMEEINPTGVSEEAMFKHGGAAFTRRLNATQMEAVQKGIERVTLEQALATQETMGFLATATSLAPFLGLLATVWGVMGTFQGMGEMEGSLTLAEVAPGVASALLGTIMGLIVAIPSSFGYNYLNERIRELMVQLDNFAGEFLVELKRYYAPDGGA